MAWSMVVKGIVMGAALLWLLRGRVVLVGASSSGLPCYAVAGAAAGAGCARYVPLLR